MKKPDPHPNARGVSLEVMRPAVLSRSSIRATNVDSSDGGALRASRLRHGDDYHWLHVPRTVGISENPLEVTTVPVAEAYRMPHYNEPARRQRSRRCSHPQRDSLQPYRQHGHSHAHPGDGHVQQHRSRPFDDLGPDLLPTLRPLRLSRATITRTERTIARPSMKNFQ